MTYRVLVGDCRERMAAMPEASIDAIVCDPPYGLEFMGKAWDAPWRTGDGFRRSRNEADAGRDNVFGRASKRGPEYRAGIGFQAWCEEWAIEALRVLKPGGHLLAFGGTRTYHRMACAIEDAGFEVRDCLAWLYGSGFPKSLDVSKAIDKLDARAVRLERARSFQAWLSQHITPQRVNEITGTQMGHHLTTHPTQPEVATADLFDKLRPHLPAVPPEIEPLVAERTVESENFKRREVVGEVEMVDTSKSRTGFAGDTFGGTGDTRVVAITAAHTPEAEAWQGWGTALKPAHEPIILARKPLVGTVAANVLTHGTGALNIDATRIAHASDADLATSLSKNPGRSDVVTSDVYGAGRPQQSVNTEGRWPANVILDDEAWEPVLRLTYNVSEDAYDLLAEWCDARNGGMSELRSTPRRPAKPSETTEVLLALVPSGLDANAPTRRRAPDVRAATHAGVDREDGGQPEGEPADGAALSGVEGWPLPDARLRDDRDDGAASGRANALRFDGESQRESSDPGASPRDGEEAAAPASFDGARPPHQRREERQPAGELGDARRADAQDDARRALPRTAPATRARYEVLLRDVPAAWLKFFDFTGDVVRVDAAAILDAQTGTLTSGGGDKRGGCEFFMGGDKRDEPTQHAANSGSASRFFYCAKASRRERNAGLDGFEAKGRTIGHKRCAACGRQKVNVPGSECKCPEPREWVAVEDHSPRANHHPTVKPIDVMRWLCRLVTPPGGVILDPFTGSGTTGIAALLEGFDFVGCEQDAEYAAITEARLALFALHGEDALEAVRILERADAEREAHAARGQLGLFA